jgi:hypothetical protein
LRTPQHVLYDIGICFFSDVVGEPVSGHRGGLLKAMTLAGREMLSAAEIDYCHRQDGIRPTTLWPNVIGIFY